ncbi:ATPase [Rhizoctonia solani]|uniref:Midasin n=1 Tax=Rhizoctonia solani TaxID=456999 RepID=A0A8H7M6Y0_9AGAM|nr:ATPase [Rhizoctonia solani]
MDLCARWLDDDDVDEVDRLVALCLLVEPYEEIFPVLTSHLLSHGPLRFLIEPDLVMSEVPALHLQRILIAYYRLLGADPSTPARLGWSAALLQVLFRPVLGESSPHPNHAVRWLALRCFGLQTHLSEITRTQLETEFVNVHDAELIELHVGQRLPTLLSATSASGKMTLLRELARRIHPQGEQGLVVLQLADTSLDAKSLIGSYVSASATQGSTGSFEWQDGAIPRALRSGKWLVLADVDRASTEVLATFLPLVENMRPGKFIGELPSLDLGGGRGRIQGAPSFMLFGMRSVGKIINDKAHVYAPPTFFGHKHWFEVQFLPPSVEELVSLSKNAFPASRITDVGMRDLEKFCARLEQLSLPNTSSSTRGSSLSRLFPNHVIREDILLEARDVFFAAYELGTQHFNLLAHRATALLDLDDERASWVVPNFKKMLQQVFSDLGVSKNFALHRPALTLLESIATSVKTRESILLVGETGTGKTTSVQHAAQLTHTPLVVLNLSNQSEASDLLGGFRPIDARVPAGKLQEMFTELFGETFSRKKNKPFEDAVRSAYVGGKWARVVKMWKEAGKMAGVDNARDQAERGLAWGAIRRTQETEKLNSEWENFMREVDEFDAAHVKGNQKFVFSFVEGPLVTALRKRSLILLDEINLASSETLECISSILQGPHGSVTLTEAGQLDPVPRHPGFRLFACMNPATDAGKKDLPPNIRSRFTEFYVPPPMLMRKLYEVAITDVADFYITAKRLTATRQLADGQNHVPHFSMRTLARALTFASDLTPIMKLRRALWEGIAMAITMTLDTKSAEVLRSAAEKHILGGPTSSGKTSSVEYLAKQTGHRFVRINNHEHTDLQEYLGSYMTDPATGKLKFQDGVLVRALRAGDWIVLDELNLAPTDVLEALNRLLDDNRELVVPETNEIIRPHPNFMLFATQNPPGLYAGRKVLSRAFRNRFLEVHFDDVPQDELETILCQRCGIAQSHGRKIVAVFQELQKRRQVERVFETKNSFATLRDLFRWANRHSEGYTENATGGNYQHIAEQGYMLLAERARRADDRAVVKAVIEDIMKVKIDEHALYDLTSKGSQERIGIPVPTRSNIIWTGAMSRLFTLVAAALRYNEPVLLIGETGSGKTSVCELLALAMDRSLYSLSCHQNTETADLLGSQRPLRNRQVLRDTAILEATQLLHSIGFITEKTVPSELNHTIRLVESALKSCPVEQATGLREALSALNRSTSLFEWHDGPLIQAMREGGLFLLDEISLADDSVLERLNSVLEPSRQLVLAEKGGDDFSLLTITAKAEFQLVATMNPGGDYGKKELSPALRNRFTEIWVPHVDQRADLFDIIQHSWKDGRALWSTRSIGMGFILEFLYDFNTLSLDVIFHHSARLTILDGIPTLSSVASLPLSEISRLRLGLEEKLHELVPLSSGHVKLEETLDIGVRNNQFWVGSFSVAIGNLEPIKSNLSLHAPTTLMNASRVVRALQIPKPLLLEGSPGVGKTSLILALARYLFGSDMPIEGGNPGEFAWRDAAFLRAMQNGDWVLLDEMNLAPQAVLEGLNAVLDHRGTVFIPELGREFTKHPNFRVFAAQNPLGQGGGRKGLPKSFVNRFTKVFVEALSRDDLQAICGLIDSDLGSGLADMLTFNERLCEQVINNGRFGREGSPWEFNLRDLIRWISLWKSPGLPFTDSPYEYIEDAYLARLNQVQFGHTLSSRSSGLVLPPSLALLQDQSLNMEVASKCIDSGWLLILNGPTHSGKTSLIRAIASLRGEDLREFCMSPGTDATDLLGGFEHSNRELSLRNLLSHINTFLEMALVLTGSLNSKLTNLSQSLATALEASGPEKSAHSVSLLKEIRHQLVELHGSTSSKVVDRIDNFILQDPSSPGRFEWIDGPLVKAMKEGQWLVLDHCNLCNPAVLDRLNSLCETDGVLVLSERGTIDGEIPVIVPHPNFRLFMLLNSRYGELSRAMRNRGIEVTMAPVKNPTDIARIRQSARLISSFESNQDSLTEDTVLIQLIRRGLALRGSDQVGTKRVPILPNLVLAATDSQAFRLAPILSVLDAPLGIKKDTKEDIAKLLFMATSVSRDSWYILSHYLSAFGHRNIAQLWINLSGHHILENSDSLGARVGTERGVSSPFLLSQPVLHHLNTNLVTPSLVPGLYHESVMQELGWEAVVQAQTLPLVNPLTNAPSNDLLSIMDKSRLVWGGLGAVVNIPHYVRSIAPFLSALNHACQSSLNTPDVGLLHTPNFAAIQTVVQLVGVALSEFSSSSVHFQQAVEITNKLMQDVRLKSGQGMLQIWSIMQQPTPTQSTQDLISRIAIGPGSLFGADGRRERLEIIAMLYIQESSELIECANKILKVETERASTIADDTMMGFDHQETCIAMAVIMSRAFRGTSTAQINAVFFDAACRVPSLDLRALAFLRLLLWEVDLPIMKPSDSLLLPEVSLRLLNRHNPHMLFAIQLQWMRACWSASESQTPTLGPQSMLMSVEYPACLARCDPPPYASAHMINIESAFKHKDSESKHKHTYRQMRESYHLPPYGPTPFPCSQLTEGEQHQISRIQENLHRTIDERSACLAMTELALFLCKCSCSLLAQMAQKHLSDLNNSLDLVAFDSISATKFIGEAWIRCAYMLLELYFPDVAMDPLGGQATHRHLWEIRTEWLELYEQALELGRQLGLGTNYDSGLRRLYDSTCEARKQYDQLKPTTVRGPEHLRHLTEMFAEAHTFLAQAIERPRIFQLIESLKSSSANSQTQEELVQQTVANFLQRLRQNYPTLSDVVAPLEYALQQLKLGLRLYASSIAQTESNRSDVSAITQSLLQRPSIRSAHAILKLDVATVSPVVPLAVSSSEWIIAQISALLLSKCVQEMPRLALRPLTKLYNSFLDLWLSQKAREARAEEDARSLYKPNKLDSAGESEEIEMEREFNELFPSFGDILDDTTPSATHTAREIVRSIMSVTTKDIEDIYQLHNSWAMLQSDSQQASLHIYSTGSLDTSVDAAGFSRQMEMLRSSRNHLESSMSADFNFYQDYSALEMNKAARLLDDFCARLATLIVEWPDQMVLQHLQERCQAIQQLRLNTPLAKVLSALEQLLLHTADWETYANKDNSLKGQQQQLTDLIIDWRQIELKSWSTLLDRELLSSANSVSSWWPRLYESIVGVIASFEGDQTKVSNHLQQLVPLLDSYLAQSPLGQFECRLTLLRSFAELTKQLSEDSISLESFSKVSDVVKSLCVQYLALLPLVRESLKKQRATLDKDIKDFIKLASWKDTNVHALKQSAQKTHHVLYKCIRKFREIIRQPVSDLVSSAEPNDLSASARFKINLLLALEKYQGYAGGLGKQLVFNKATELIHDLTTRIISGAKELADVPVPESGARARHIKALVSRKRRAWSELLKELKRLGLSGAITTDTFIQHEDRAFLLSLYVNPDHGHFFSEAISKSNLQFSRLLQTLPEMRAALPCHHPDVSTRDFQRACNLVESSFSHPICERLERIVGIRALINGGDPVASVGEQSLGSVHSIQATVAEIHASLAELVKDISRFHSVADTSDVPVTIREVLENATTESAEILTSITSLKKRGTLLEIPIWTRGEAKVFDNARVFISDIKATFGRISNDPSIPVRLFQPICDWLKSLEVPVPLDYPEPRPDETLPSVDEIISKLLTGMQTIVTSQNLTMALLNEEEIPDKAIRIAVEHTRKITSVLGIPDIEQAFGLFVRRIACMNGDQIAYSIDRLAPFLQVYTNLARNGLAETLSWLGSISRLTITLASTVRNIMQKGFCRPPDIEDEGDNSKGGQELTEGTVEGLKGENDSGEKGSKNGEDGENKDAIEMSEDFTGEMEDVSSDDEDEDDGSKSGSEGDPEERIQELDSANSNTVDEKLWNDETASEKPEGQDQAGEDKTAQSNEQSQTAAKEDKPQQSKESSRVNGSEQPTEDDKVEEEAEAEGMEEQTEQVSDGRKMDDFVPEANTLDLPDDIDLGPSDDKEANDTEDGIGDEDTIMGDGESVDESADNHDESHEPDPTSQATTDDATEADPNFEADQTIPGDNKEKGDEERDHNPEHRRRRQPRYRCIWARQPGGEHTPETKTDTAVENDSTDPTAGGSDTQTRPQGTSQRQEKPPKQELPNPLRSLGDASKEIQRRVDEILNRQNAPSIQPEPVQDAAEVEYMQNEDDDQEMQALGPSNEVDETAKLRDLRIDEDTQGVPQDDRTVDADIEMDPVAPSNVKQEPAEPRNHSLEAALTAEELSHPMHGPMDNLATNSETSTKREVELEENVPLDSAMVERTIAEWQASAPTRATRLRGDFRTGKRLNMKKLVPYVASDFTRDKIWLRRTRPAAREYQVLLAVDDSRSMAREPHTIHLTRQALALVARALEKLEVGELALARFGREMEVVHEFGAGVLQGGAALNKFTFNQPATDVLRLVESSLDVLRSAREGSNTSSSADLWQLEIVISDGICQDHERLRTVLRRAEEERVMVVFVVVDTPASNGSQESSIVSMLQPTIKMVNGKMDIQMERYLDSFPFRYFVVLRDVDALPSVLAGTLRQFFERISED